MSRKHNKRQNGITLPLALQKELGFPESNRGDGRRRHNGGANNVADRKERRKAMRKGESHKGSQTRRARIEEDDIIGASHGTRAERQAKPTRKAVDEDIRRPELSNTDGKKEVGKSISTGLSKSLPAQKPKSILKIPRLRSSTPDRSASDDSRSSSPGLVLDPNSASFKTHAAEDDEDIAALERKLGIKGKKASKLGDDMLDYVLEGLDGSDTGIGSSRKRKREGQDWLDQKRAKHIADAAEDIASDDKDSESSDDSGEFNMEDLSDDEDDAAFALEDVRDPEDDDNVSEEEDASDGIDDSITDDFAGFESDPDDEQPQPGTKAVKKPRENPYVAPVDPGATSGKYIPPSLRKRDNASTDNLEPLSRQIQGLLNKLSEANMISILGEVEKIYQTRPRQDVTTVLIDLILSSFCIRSALQNTFIILHAAFATAVYKVIGIDFGAELLSRLVERFDREYRLGSGNGGKESLNLLSLLSNLFTFHLIGSTIIYDHVKILLSKFNEYNAELLLRVVRDCGPQLRSDNPGMLKSMVQTVQDTSTTMEKLGQPINIRTRVMIDAMIDLKNNKMKNATNAAGVTGEHITRMRKVLGSLSSRNLKASEPLRVSRDDIINSDKKGKWWLVGASWKGHDSSGTPSHQETRNGDRDGDTAQSDEEDQEVDFLALARQYGMNTDVRRSIFVAIMSASDCRDAQTRLLKLRLSTKQQEEIAKVLLRCARAEPVYNPYYALLARSLCKDNKKMRFSFQFGLWNFFSQLGEKSDRGDDDDDDGNGDDSNDASIDLHEVVNIAKMYASLIFRGDVVIGILKTLNFGFLREKTTMLVEVLLISIMTQPKADEDTLMKVFGRAMDSPQIVKGLRYFIKKNVRKSDLVSKKDKDKVREGCQIADVAFGMIDSVTATD